jgi:porphobilinogen synthase
MIVMPDVALDPYSILWHDGIIANGDVENDATNDALVKWPFSCTSRSGFCSGLI